MSAVNSTRQRACALAHSPCATSWCGADSADSSENSTPASRRASVACNAPRLRSAWRRSSTVMGDLAICRQHARRPPRAPRARASDPVVRTARRGVGIGRARRNSPATPCTSKCAVVTPWSTRPRIASSRPSTMKSRMPLASMRSCALTGSARARTLSNGSGSRLSTPARLLASETCQASAIGLHGSLRAASPRELAVDAGPRLPAWPNNRSSGAASATPLMAMLRLCRARRRVAIRFRPARRASCPSSARPRSCPLA